MPYVVLSLFLLVVVATAWPVPGNPTTVHGTFA